jgi:TonB family protein
LVGSHNFHGYDGREYALTVGELTGVLHAYATRKRFYAIISLNTKKDETIREKFLSSFILPDKPPENRTTATNQANAIDEQNVEPETSEGPTRRRGARRSGNSEGGSVQGGEGQENAQATNEPTGNHTPNTQTNAPAKRGPINGGMLNGRAIYLPLPEVAAGEATGVVLVQVLIDEQGAVIEARAVSGPPQLQAAAVNAARLARFNPTLLMGEPVRVSGTLSYNFVKSN